MRNSFYRPPGQRTWRCQKCGKENALHCKYPGCYHCIERECDPHARGDTCGECAQPAEEGLKKLVEEHGFIGASKIVFGYDDDDDDD